MDRAQGTIEEPFRKSLGKKAIAQGTIEYLVIIAIVIVLALTLTTILINTSTNQQISQNTNDISSKIGSGSISISEAISDSSGDSLITLQNVGSSPITITKISTGEQESNYSNVLGNQDTFTISLNDINIDCPCLSGQKQISCNYTITYTQNGIPKTTTINKTTTCVETIEPANPSKVVGLGSGTLTDPWIINSCKELQKMSANLNGNFALATDINCYETRTWNNGLGWKPVGTSQNFFSGNFDGKNFEIKNLYINRPLEDNIGFFGYASGGNITNIDLIDFNIIGKDSVGGLIGYSRSTVNNSFITGNIIGNDSVGGVIGKSWSAGSFGPNGSITNSIANVSVLGNINVGGLVGQQYMGLVTNTHSLGNVFGQTKTGGLIGYAWTVTISQSLATGDVNGVTNTGGLIGSTSTTTTSNCFSSGNIIGTTDTGGLMGFNGGTITNSYSSGNVIGNNRVGGLIGQGASVSNSYSTGNVQGNSDTGGFIGLKPIFGGTITNAYWNNHAGNPNNCYSGGNTNCTAIDNNENYFFDSSKPPMQTNWNFETIWEERENDYPILKWQTE